MPDLYATIVDVDPQILDQLAGILEARAAQPRQRAMLDAYLAEVQFPEGAWVLEVGCGTGPVARVLAALPGVGQVIGVDPSAHFVARARELSTGASHLSFETADGRALPFEDGSFDVVVIHTVVSHVPGVDRVLAEASRVLRAGGSLAVFDGDYSTITVATGDNDPLQSCIDAARDVLVNDAWIVRRLNALVQSAGLDIVSFRSHGYVETEQGYIMSLVDRGAAALAATGRIGDDLAAALKTEARRRVDAGNFFGQISYASIVGRKRP